MRINKVPKSTPNAIDTATAIRNCDCILGSRMIGSKPATVVSEVSRIGLNREIAASTAASFTVFPALSNSLYRSKNTIASFTRTPINAIIPNIDKIEIGIPISPCPIIAPATPAGITSIIKNALLKLLK